MPSEILWQDLWDQYDGTNHWHYSKPVCGEAKSFDCCLIQSLAKTASTLLIALLFSGPTAKALVVSFYCTSV
jgi:hypothetical protein